MQSSTLPSPSTTPPALGADGRYQVRSLLGQGSNGAVFETWDTQLQRVVAIKRLEVPIDACRWIDEARLASRVSHPGVVTVHDVFIHEGFGHIVMERVDGRDLAAVARQGPVAPRELTQMIWQASAALAEAHHRMIVHGDVKPGNLMLEIGGRLRVLDFGIARLVDASATLEPGSSPGILGTLAYMAPEQLLGAQASTASDIHALGRVFQTLLAGNAEPVSGLDGVYRRLQVDEQVPAIADAPSALTALLRRMLQRDPARRPPAMATVRDELAVILDEWNAADPNQPAARLAWQAGIARVLLPLRRHTRRLATVTAMLAIAAATTAAFLHHAAPPWPRRVALAEQQLAAAATDDSALDDAIATLQSVLADRPGEPTAAALMALADGMEYTRDGSDPVWLDRAQASVELALRGEDQLAIVQVAAGRLATLRGRHPEAAAAFDRALALDPQNRFALAFYANDLIRQQRYDDARRLIQRALALRPRDAGFLANLGRINYEQADYVGAERAFRAAMAAEPTSPIGYAGVSLVLTRQHREEEALQVLQEGLRQRPNSTLYANLGTTLFERGDYVAAESAFAHAVSSSRGKPNDYLMWANWADALRWIPGRDADARRAYAHSLSQAQALLDRDTADATLSSRAGLYAAKLGDVARARALTARALAMAPNGPDVLFRAAVSFELSGDRDQAIARLKQALGKGYPAYLVEHEPDLAGLRRDPRYQLSIDGRSSA